LKLNHNEPLSILAFKFKLRRYNKHRKEELEAKMEAGQAILVAPKLAD